MAKATDKDWKEIAAEITNETDTRKLIKLIQQLLEALERRPHASPSFEPTPRRY